ncbi:LPXTG cell wall anchor domain-containing protein [Streptomyces smaragdinus]|uniref:LPXTG cell wall anchor domain-containing protein n=1 Tax=Streptomyces smaragdinus TaxID=2585196 RepID=UPI002B1FFA72|nr:LPXTG cell wall anchor domain-containing protein [Streptomyces smaragdinus]
MAAAAAASLMFAAPAALATNGDNGNVKIHDSKTSDKEHENEPKVCTFYITGFQFDGAQQVDWQILGWAPTATKKGEVVKTGSLTLDGTGHERTTDINLPDGHYRLVWNFDGEHGAGKHKMFWVDCDDDINTPPSQDNPGNDNPGDDNGNDKPTEAPGTEDHGTGGSDVDDASNAPDAKGGGDSLAETGATVGITSAAGLALVGAGAYLVMRRRSANQS